MTNWVIIADAHLHPFKSPSRNGGLDRLQHGLKAFRETLALAEKRGAAWLCLGDIKQVRGVWPQMALEGALQALRDYPNCLKVFLTGNGYHDGTSVKGTGESGYAPFLPYGEVISTPTIWPRDLSDDRKHIFKRLVGDADIEAVSFWPWQPSLDGLENLKKESIEQNSRILFGHGLVNDSTVSNGVKIESNLTLTKLGLIGTRAKRTFDLAFFGDVHKRQVLGDSSLRKSGCLRYPGSPYAQSRSETEPNKGALVVSISSPWLVKSLIFPIDCPRFMVCDISEMGEMTQFFFENCSDWKGNFVDLIVSSDQKRQIYAPGSKFKKILATTGALDLRVSTPREKKVENGKPKTPYVDKDIKSVLGTWVKNHPLDGFSSKQILSFGNFLSKKVE